jgi:uncharacterized membrane protein YhdT
MGKRNSPLAQRGTRIALFIIIWAIIAWLFYPLLVLDSTTTVNAKEYFYRSAIGIGLMIIMFGKTLTDLLFPLDISQKKALSYTIFLTLYSLTLAGGIIYMIARVIAVYLKSSTSTNTGLPF